MNNLRRLCLGTACLGIPGYGLSSGRKVSHREALAILRRAWEIGITCFDTASAYGEAEVMVYCGVPSRAVVTTKASPLLAEMRSDMSGWDTWRLLLHNPTTDEILEGCRWGVHGASVYAPEEAHAAIAIGLRILQIPYHALDQRHAKAGVFEAAKAAGVTVMARQPWCRGLMLLGGVDVIHRMKLSHTSIAADAANLVTMYGRVCARHSISPLEAGLRFSLESPADMIVLGVSSVEQLEQTVAIAVSEPPPSWPACYQELRETFADSGLTLGSVCTV